MAKNKILEKFESQLHDVDEALAEQDSHLVHMNNYLVGLNKDPANKEMVNYLWAYLQAARTERKTLCDKIGKMYEDLKTGLTTNGTTGM